MIPDYGEKVYTILSDLTGLKFKAQLKGSGIEFKSIYKMQNLVGGSESYLLFLDDTSIWFRDRDGFINEFITFLAKSLEDLNARFEEINYRLARKPFADEYAIYEENEYIGVCGAKRQTLLQKMREFKATRQ
ncbi:hypothetical protein [Coprobacter tertius]|uniref:Uncharacterized protein n=1 Tax=Coprobacter tertius TaxID=2944915 RepID=A0ABT1MG86_9BACT|nr:hypothetical protein [Coprobacter tertius]MCP9611371.1 hypothetical protein [Coprobacter tertius]